MGSIFSNFTAKELVHKSCSMFTQHKEDSHWNKVCSHPQMPDTQHSPFVHIPTQFHHSGRLESIAVNNVGKFIRFAPPYLSADEQILFSLMVISISCTLLNTHVYRAVRRCICLREANDLLLDLPSIRSFVTKVFVTYGGSALLDKRMLRDRLALDSRRTAATI